MGRGGISDLSQEGPAKVLMRADVHRCRPSRTGGGIGPPGEGPGTKFIRGSMDVKSRLSRLSAEGRGR